MAVTVVGLVATVGMNFTRHHPAARRRTSSAATPPGYGFLMTASGIGALVAAVGARRRPASRARSGSPRAPSCSASRPSPSRVSTSFPLVLLLMVPIGAGGITMAATANATIQLARPRRPARPGDERLHDGLLRVDARSAAWPRAPWRRPSAIPATVAIGGVLSLATGVGAFVWWRRIAAAAGQRHARRSERRRPRPGCRTRGPAAVALPAVGRTSRRPASVGRAEHERRVQAAEAERGAQHPPVGRRRDRPAAGRAAGPPMSGSSVHEVDRRRRPAVADRQRADRRLDRAGRARAGGRTAPSCR